MLSIAHHSIDSVSFYHSHKMACPTCLELATTGVIHNFYVRKSALLLTPTLKHTLKIVMSQHINDQLAQISSVSIFICQCTVATILFANMAFLCQVFLG